MTCEDLLDKLDDVELGLVHIGNLGRVEPVERLPERAHCLEGIAFVEFGLQHRNTGINQSVLDMREPSSGMPSMCWFASVLLTKHLRSYVLGSSVIRVPIEPIENVPPAGSKIA